MGVKGLSLLRLILGRAISIIRTLNQLYLNKKKLTFTKSLFLLPLQGKKGNSHLGGENG